MPVGIAVDAQSRGEVVLGNLAFDHGIPVVPPWVIFWKSQNPQVHGGQGCHWAGSFILECSHQR